MAKFYWTVKQNDFEWFLLRAGKPTASAMDKIITPGGKKPREDTTERYMNRLLCEWITGVPYQGDDYQSAAMQKGHENEEPAANRFEFHKNVTLEKLGFVTTDDGLVGASPDRAIRLEGDRVIGVEIKSPIGPTQTGYLLRPELLREEYHVQVQSQIFVLESDKAWLCADCADCPTLPPVHLEIGRDAAFIREMETRLDAFLDQMLAKRERLEREFGPFKRPDYSKKDKPVGDCGDFGVGMADFDDLQRLWEMKQAAAGI